MTAPFDMRFGAALLENGHARFRLWAPGRETVKLDLMGREPLTMQARTGGWFELEAPCAVGASYRYLFEDGMAVHDLAARAQQGGVHGRSLVIDPNSYRWKCSAWKGRSWAETVLYELNVGVLGGFNGVQEKLPRLCDLGVTDVELMPVNAFPGRRNWGYDGVLPFAPAEAYGAPDDLKALVDAAHELGLMIFLDVVYNHFGPDGNYLGAYAPTFFR